MKQLAQGLSVTSDLNFSLRIISSQIIFTRRLFLIAFAFFICFTYASQASAATYLVTTNADNTDGTSSSCNPGSGGLCTLRQAINAANYVAGDDTITFAAGLVGVTITVNPQIGTILINTNMLIDATSAGGIQVSGGDILRVFTVNNNSTVTMRGFAVRQGSAGGNGGGGIGVVGSALTLDRMIITDNTANFGGGIYAAGIAGVGSLTITNSTIAGNNGGGIFSTVALILNNVYLRNNHLSSATLNIAGGGLYSGSANGSTITNCVISGNTISSSVTGLNKGGSGVYFDRGINYISGTTIFDNSATNGNGGGLSVQNSATLTLVNSTVSGNAADNGGGLLIESLATATLTNLTIARNTAATSGGGIFHVAPQTNSVIEKSNFLLAESLDINNTIVADNTAPVNSDIDGIINSLGNNLVRNRGTSTGYSGSDLPDGTNPRLAPLGQYGGSLFTYALANNSPAVNAGNNTGTIATDQRGATRQGSVDIGAFEVNSTYTAALPSGKVNEEYDQTLVPNSNGFTYTLASGNFPPGLSLTTSFAPNAAVGITGIPTMAGTYNFIIRATDTNENIVDTNYQIFVAAAPTAASVAVGGRVTSGEGRGIFRARVYLTDATGETRTALTGSFGYYRFDEVPAGQTYTLSVSHKRHTFAPQVLTVTEDINDLNFMAQP